MGILSGRLMSRPVLAKGSGGRGCRASSTKSVTASCRCSVNCPLDPVSSKAASPLSTNATDGLHDLIWDATERRKHLLDQTLGQLGTGCDSFESKPKTAPRSFDLDTARRNGNNSVVTADVAGPPKMHRPVERGLRHFRRHCGRMTGPVSPTNGGRPQSFMTQLSTRASSSYFNWAWSGRSSSQRVSAALVAITGKEIVRARARSDRAQRPGPGPRWFR